MHELKPQLISNSTFNIGEAILRLKHISIHV